MKTLEQRWQEFAACIFAGVSISSVQREETRRAFYAGMLEMFSAVSEEVAALPDGEAERALSSFHDQIGAYADELVALARATRQSPQPGPPS